MGLVEFRDGVAIVTDPEVAQALREVPDVFGIAEDVAEEGRVRGPASSSAAPPQSASKAVWVAWAVQAGLVDDGQAEDLTKAQIIELAAELAASVEEN